MNKDISKAQMEVWAWKQVLHDEIKDLPLEVGIHHILAKGARLREELEQSGKLKVHHPIEEIRSYDHA